MNATANGLLRTVAAVIADARGRVLLVRKRGSPFFIQPGGKREAGEAPLATLARELREELGVAMMVGTAHPLGEFEAAAVNEPGRRVRALAFAVAVQGQPSPRAEIDAMAWLEPAGPHPVPVAPLSATCILPAWLAGRDPSPQ